MRLHSREHSGNDDDFHIPPDPATVRARRRGNAQHLQEAATQIVQAANVSATANATDAPDAAAAQLRSLLAGETPPTERWGTYRDETEPKGPGVKLRYTPGDARMLALVRLANQSFRYVLPTAPPMSLSRTPRRVPPPFKNVGTDLMRYPTAR